MLRDDFGGTDCTCELSHRRRVMTGFHFSPDVVESLARQCFGEPNRRLSTTRELRFGRRGSVAVVPERGVFADHEAGVAGGMLKMLIHAGAASTTAEAARLIEEDGYIVGRQTAAERHDRARAADVALAAKRASAATLLSQAQPLAGTVAETYLREGRAIAAALDGADLGFLSSAPVWPYQADCRDRRPAMIAKVTDARGRLLGAHLTYLQTDGSGKAAMPSPRKVAGARFGGFVRLEPGADLVVGEGIESTLSAWQARPAEARDFGAVAGICAGGVSGLVWPRETRALIIAPDRDTAGHEAAEGLGQRAWAAGLTVSLMWPPEAFGDWNDAARAERVRP